MVDEPLKKPARYHHGDLARALVVAAHDLIEEEGIGALTLRAVAQRVGVTHAAPYRHFKDKAALVAAVAARSLQELGERMQAEENAAAAAGAYLRFATSRAASYSIMFSADALAHPPDFRSRLAPPSLDPERREALAVAIWSLCHGLAVLVNSGRLKTAAPDVLASHAARVLIESEP